MAEDKKISQLHYYSADDNIQELPDTNDTVFTVDCGPLTYKAQKWQILSNKLCDLFIDYFIQTMDYHDYFTGLSNVAEAIMLDTRIVFDGIDKASGAKRIITVFFYEAA